MILKNKKSLIFASLATLLPIPVGLALWDRFPAVYGAGYFVFAIPLSMLVAQWICVLFSAMDQSNRGRNRKPIALVLWIIPFISCLFCGIMYAIFLGVDFSPAAWSFAGIGLLMAVIGNYLPKCRMNAIMGIKTRTTYSSEANWNATHRFGGKVWTGCGAAMMLCALLPDVWGVVIMIFAIAVMILLPMAFSYRFYCREKAEGKDVKLQFPVANKKIVKGSAVFLAALLIFVGCIMFVGNLNYRFDEESFTVEADFYTDLTIRYDEIDAIEYRDSNIPGIRVGGFGSARLLMGFFRNDEFGTYTRYTYTKPGASILLTVEGKPLVLSGVDAAQTQELYQALCRAAGL